MKRMKEEKVKRRKDERGEERVREKLNRKEN